MNDRQFRYILEIAKEGSITAAAQNLFISQPSLSNFLANVEEEIGAKIFDRSVVPMVPTYAGEKYIEAAKKVLGIMQELQSRIDDMRDTLTGRLHIGCGNLSPFVIPFILPILMERFPGIQFKLTEDHFSVLEELLLKGLLDVILYAAVKITHPNVVCTTLTKDEMVLLCPIDFIPQKAVSIKNKSFPCIDLTDLADRPFVLMKKKYQLRTIQDMILKDIGYTPNIILETDHWQTCLRMVENRMAHTFLPYAKIGVEPQNIGKFSLPGDYYRETYLCYRKNAYFSKALKEFISVVCSLLRQNTTDQGDNP
ncbi:MAG: LysR family transcriptional regulator [Spirochaetaceae bacterium]|jgi:DNA-binding transcriptional LysR family regulator|nr:LysR family transcriptional regulator [Spirochaetaceae bacterium]